MTFGFLLCSMVNIGAIFFSNVSFSSFSALGDMGPIEKYQYRYKDHSCEFLDQTDQNLRRKLSLLDLFVRGLVRLSSQITLRLIC